MWEGGKPIVKKRGQNMGWENEKENNTRNAAVMTCGCLQNFMIWMTYFNVALTRYSK